MRLSARTEELLQVVTVLDNRIDAAVALEFKENMRQITENAPEKVLLDLSAVVFIDSWKNLGACRAEWPG
jgi:anti-sigma B factor antagonist